MKRLTILVGTVGQSVMRSSDGGNSWERIGPRRGFPYEASVRCVAIHPDRRDIAFAGTERGLYQSDDAGAHWRLLDSALNQFYIWALAIDPVDPSIMFAGTGTPTPATIFRSTDAGASWDQRPVEVAAECENVGTPRVTAIAIDPQERHNVWMGLEVDGARRSSDGGQTWTDVPEVHGKDVHNVAVIPGPPKTILIVANREIYKSSDNGATWQTLGMQQNVPWEYSRSQTYLRGIAIPPSPRNTVLLGVGDATPGMAGGIARSRDIGENWEMLPLRVQPNSTIWTFATNAADPDLLFAASRYGYLYRSDSGGESWVKLAREFSEIAAVQWLPE